MKTNELPNIRTSKGLDKFKLKKESYIDDASLRGVGVQNSIKDVDYYRIGNFATGSSFFKYMDIETALISLEKGTLRFAEPSRWDDQYESRFYTADYSNVLNGKKEEEVCPLLYASCFSNKKDDEPAWKIYTYGKTGVGSKCVQFKLDRKELRGQLISNLSNCCIYEGCVSYVWQGFIDTIHRKYTQYGDRIKLNSLFFDEFDFNKYLNLMLIKRDAFEHEHETRIMIIREVDKSKTKAEKQSGSGKPVFGGYLDVKINWSKVIKEVRYDDSCTKDQKQRLLDTMKKVNSTIVPRKYWINGRKSHITINKP